MSDDIDRDTLLRRIAAELRDMTGQTARIEDAMADVWRTPATAGSTARTVVQEIDRLRQTQAALATCLDTIADTAPSRGTLDRSALLDGTVLHSVAERLLGCAPAPDAAAGGQDPEIW